VPIWDPHKLAGQPQPRVDLVVGQRCRALVDLPGVPAGTGGKVILADGFAWPRYRVRFDNGVEHGFLDGRHLEAGKVPLSVRIKARLP
jgi:hypothetical protein